MNPILYGVGVGPGDPELMTVKACRLIRENEVIAVPGKTPRDSVAYQIAVQAVPELADKTLVSVDMPMVRDREELRRYHKAAARQLERWLDQGKNVVFLTLGDPSIYSTFSYLSRIAANDGYSTEMVSGVPSFCAAAARLNMPLAEGSEPLHIFPVTGTHGRHSTATAQRGTSGGKLSDQAEKDSPQTSDQTGNSKPRTSDQTGIDSSQMADKKKQRGVPEADSARKNVSLTFAVPGNYVLMKTGSRMAEMRQAIQESGRKAAAVENCGMSDEKVYRTLAEMPDEGGYFSLVVVK